MNRPLHYRIDGTPYTGTFNEQATAWAKDFEKKSRIIKQETLPNGIWVSTIWLGIDHSFGGEKPLIFESMAFKTKDGGEELDIDRYSTIEEARVGHERIVKKYARKPAVVK